MPLDTLLDLPIKDKLASDILDADSDFELDIRVITIPGKNQPMASNTATCATNCDNQCHSNTCGTCLTEVDTCGVGCASFQPCNTLFCE